MMSKDNPKIYGFFGLLWRLTLVGMIVLTLGAVGGYFAVMKMVETPSASTPDLLTLSVERAVERASKGGFSVMIAKHEASDLLDPSHILGQRPSPGIEAKVGSTIHLTVAERP